MRFALVALLLSLSLLPLCAGADDPVDPVDPPDPWLTGSLAVEITSRYIQAGVDTGRSSPVLSENFELAAHDFSLGVSRHAALTKAYDEADLYLDYTHVTGPLILSGGYVYAYQIHGSDRGLHDFYSSAALPFAKYYKISLNGELDLAQSVGTFAEIVATATYPVIKEKLSLAPYAALGSAQDYTAGATTGLNSRIFRFGVNAPLTINSRWELNFQAETVFSPQLPGQVWFGTRLIYNF